MNIGALILTPLVLAASASWAQPQAPANPHDRTGAPTTFGNAVNKIRLIRTPDGTTGYAIGVDMHRIWMESHIGDRKVP